MNFECHQMELLIPILILSATAVLNRKTIVTRFLVQVTPPQKVSYKYRELKCVESKHL